MPDDRDIDRLQDEIEGLFADLWQVPRFTGLRRGFRPPADCYRTDDPPELTVVVELAGVDPESIQIVASGRTLLVTGERTLKRVDGRSYQQIEIEYGPFKRKVVLPEDVDSDAARAEYRRGLLTVTLPVAAKPPAPARVAIVVRRAP